MAVPSPEFVDELPKGNPRGVPNVKVTSMKTRGAVSQPEDRLRTRNAEMPFLMEHDILKVTNIDGVPWEFRWDRRRYLVKPKATGYVPFPAVSMMMGDPRSVRGSVTRFNTDDGQRGIIADRSDVFTSLFAFYGIENEKMEDLVDFAPKLEVRTMAEDILVTFPVQNPDMPPWPVPQAPQPGRENSDMRRLTDNLAEENRQMKEELADLKAMISGRLSPPVGQPDPRVEADDGSDDLAAALAGATIDQGPSSQIR
jgi:hypothetical protein